MANLKPSPRIIIKYLKIHYYAHIQIEKGKKKYSKDTDTKSKTLKKNINKVY